MARTTATRRGIGLFAAAAIAWAFIVNEAGARSAEDESPKAAPEAPSAPAAPSPAPAAPASPPAAPKKCVPETDAAFCERLGAMCGRKRGNDNCGVDRTVASCGACTVQGETCGAAGKPNVCVCTPESNAAFCKRLGATCGTMSGADNCGVARTVESCGGCGGPGMSCGGGGKPNVCGCTPEADAMVCARAGATCGPVRIADNCGAARAIADCGACSGPGETCGGGGKASTCGCAPETNASFCKRMAATCGAVSGTDNCGGPRSVASCGACSGKGVTCGGGGKPGVCGCTPESDAELCARVGANCGSLTIADNCGAVRTVASCGTCAGGSETCGGGGKANQCGCTPESNASFCKRVGATCGAASGTDNCGAARSVESCGTCSGKGMSCGGGGKPSVCGCTPESDDELCARVGANCGALSAVDNCGAPRKVASCGTCTGPGEACGIGGKANVCACTAESHASFCKRLGATCGTLSGTDNCGAPRTVESCGGCGGKGVSCGGGGKANQCGCTPESESAICARVGATCGAVSAVDNCGGARKIESCGTCAGPGESCAGAGKANQCGCMPESNASFCKRLGATCGALSGSDNCGAPRTAESCGACSGTGVTCGGGGQANACGCTPEPDSAICARLGAACGPVSAVDNCGGARTVESCGACSGTGVTCGGGGKANACGCTPEPDATFCARAGAACGAKSGTDNCGVARSVAACGVCDAGFFCTAENTCFTSELSATTALAKGPGLSSCGSGESCARSLLVPGGTVSRRAKGSTATVADVRLDKYEVTVGRFRRFVDAWASGWRPAPGAGKHEHLNGGRGLADTQGGSEAGWSASWSAYVGAPSASALAPTQRGASTVVDFTKALACSATQATWTAAAGSNEDKPQNCLSWYDLHAFCIWDGGFLPSEAEWEFAALGGSENRPYPWGKDVPAGESRNAAYGLPAASAVGRFPAGDGRFGHSDLSGNVWEWTLDVFGSLEGACTNCSKLGGSSDRMMRGGSFLNEASFLGTGVRISSYPAHRSESSGGRCARKP